MRARLKYLNAERLTKTSSIAMSGGRSRDVGSGRGSRPERHNVNLSKALSWLLRHNMLNQGLKPTPEGYVDLSAVLSLPRFKGYTAADVEEVVELNDKKRFAIRVHPDTGNKQIRANQGHSIQVSRNLA